MEEKRIITLKEARKELKELGYKIATKRYSEFTSGSVIHIETEIKVNAGTVFSRAFLDEHKAYFDYQRGIRKVVNEHGETIIGIGGK